MFFLFFSVLNQRVFSGVFKQPRVFVQCFLGFLSSKISTCQFDLKILSDMKFASLQAVSHRMPGFAL